VRALSPQSPHALQWLLLSIGVVAFIAVTGVVGLRFVAPLLPGFHHHPTIHEAKGNLKALYTSQRAWYQEKDTYTEDLERLGFFPEVGNRYTYFSAVRGRVLKVEERNGSAPTGDSPRPPYQIIAADPKSPRFRGTFETFARTRCPLTLATLPDGTHAGLGVTPPSDGSGPGVFIGAAVANLDDDSTPDCWSIATVERVAADGTRIAPGEPYNELNDVEH
jgi:type IV pilus assembly protein PilA